MAALSVGAGLAIFVLLAEPEGELAPRLLGTAGFLALSSLTGLCAALPVERGILPPVGVAGIVASAGSFLLGMAYVWGLVEPTEPDHLRPLAGVVVSAVALGWASLLLLLLRRSRAVTAAALATVTAITALAALLLVQVVAGEAPGRPAALATAVAAVLAILGSFLTPLLGRVIGASRTSGPIPTAPPGPSGPPSWTV